jgi:hypothetical protein
MASSSSGYRPAGNTLLFISAALTVVILSAFFALYEHKPFLWGLVAGGLILIAGRVQQARKAPRKETEILDL